MAVQNAHFQCDAERDGTSRPRGDLPDGGLFVQRDGEPSDPASFVSLDRASWS